MKQLRSIPRAAIRRKDENPDDQLEKSDLARLAREAKRDMARNKRLLNNARINRYS